jgi:hypothetical protein
VYIVSLAVDAVAIVLHPTRDVDALVPLSVHSTMHSAANNNVLETNTALEEQLIDQ